MDNSNKAADVTTAVTENTAHSGTLAKTTFAEKVYYGCGDAGGNFVWQYVAGFLTYYYTESAGIAAATAGTMMLISRFLDGISDIVMGALMEKGHSPLGKARSWIIFFMAPLCISLVLLFTVPSFFGESAKTVYMYITYILLTVICYTAVNLPYHSMVPMISSDEKDRNMLSIIRNIISCIAIGLVNIVTPFLLNMFGGRNSQRSWSIIAVLYAVCAFVLLFLCVRGVKEKAECMRTLPTAKKQPLTVALKACATNRYFYISMFVFILHYMTVGLASISIYYSRYILGDETLNGLVSIASAIPGALGLLLVPPLFNKFGRRASIIMGMAVSTAACLLTLLAPENLYFFLAMQALKTFGTIPLVTAMFTFAADIVDFGDWKTGTRAEGFAFTANSFGMKVGTGVGAAAVGWMLSYGKYDATLELQGAPALRSMIHTNLTLPAICYALILVLLLFWNLDKKYPTLRTDLQLLHEQADAKNIDKVNTDTEDVEYA